MNHHDTVVLFFQLALLLFTARTLGGISKKLGQPAVIGELLAGIVLGKVFLGQLGIDWFYNTSAPVAQSLHVIGLLGLVMLLVLTGLETDLALIRRNITSAILVSVGGLFLPLACGYGIAVFLRGRFPAAVGDSNLLPAFLAVCMSISALPVIGKVLLELKMMRRTVAQTLIAAAMIEDAVGWILLSAILSVVETGTLTTWSLPLLTLKVVAFLGASFTLGRVAVNRTLRMIQSRSGSMQEVLAAMTIIVLLWSGTAQALSLEALFGAFVCGMVLSLTPVLNNEVVHILHSVTLTVTAPLFFALAGLRVDLLAAFQGEVAVVTLCIFIGAVFCKVVGGYAGARYLAKLSPSESIFIGIGLNARGSMAVIVATIGLNAGVISSDLFSGIVIMAITTSLMAPPFLRRLSHTIPTKPDEAARLLREEQQKTSLITGIRRVLLLIRYRVDYESSACHVLGGAVIASLAEHQPIEVTMLSFVGASEQQAAKVHQESLAPLLGKASVSFATRISEEIGEAILEEAAKGYDLLIIGSPHYVGKKHQLFTPLTDYVARLAPCPTLLVRSQGHLPSSGNYSGTVLVPTNGSRASCGAAELAFAMTTTEGNMGAVSILKVVESNGSLDSQEVVARQWRYGVEHLEELQRMGDLVGAHVSGSLLVDTLPEKAIVEQALKIEAGVIILGTSLRSGAERLFLGPRVERILESAPCPVLILNS
jgi:Kef-type K+ transport system membrane component KefB/nucleotide-binding universal stress UspA family protein